MKRFLMVTFAVLFLATMASAGVVTTVVSFAGTPSPDPTIQSSFLRPTSNPDLTITGKTVVNLSDNPLTTGVASDVYWGNLSPTGCTSASTTGCYGLGVVGGTTNGIDTYNVDDDDPYEALIFTFSDLIQANTVELTLIGLNYGNVLDLQFKFSGSGATDPSGTVDWWHGTSLGDGTYIIDFAGPSSLDGGLPVGSSKYFGSFSVESNQGSFGVQSIKYDRPDNGTPIPEPASMFLLGTGLFGLAAKLRKKA